VSGTLEPIEAEAPELDVPVIGAAPQPEVRRRRPAPKRRDLGEPIEPGIFHDPDTADDATPAVQEPPARHRKQDPEPEADEASDDSGEPAETTGRAPNYTLPIALLVVALLLGGLAYWFAQQLSDARVGTGNDALSDVNATKDVVGAAQQAVAGVLSYKFDDMAGSTARAKEYLDGEAVGQYDASMKALEKEIQDQKLQVVVNPVSVGVVWLAGDDARVLVFADQIGARADKQPSGGPTQFAMDMHRTNGKWKIVKLDFFENR
jgi:Mce-associated membrane protein